MRQSAWCCESRHVVVWNAVCIIACSWVWCIPLRFAWRKRPLTASLPALQNTGSNRSTLNCLPYLIWASQSSEQSMGLYYFITHTLWSGFWKRGLVLAQAALEFTVLLHWPVKYCYKCAPLQLFLHTLNVMRFLKTMTSRGVGPFFTVLFIQISWFCPIWIKISNVCWRIF